MNKISIILPTRSRAVELKRALKSIVAQTYKDYTVYVIGHCCTDNSEQVVKSFPRVMWHTYNNNILDPGGALARNVGIRLSREPFIAYLDDDNYWYPKHLENLIKLFDVDKNLSFAISGIENRAKINPDEVLSIRRYTEIKRGVVDTSAILHRRRLIQKFGEWKPIWQGGFANDWEIVHRWVKADMRGKIHPEATLVYMNVPQKLRKEFFKSQQYKNYIKHIQLLDQKGRIYYDTQIDLLKIPIIT